MEIKFQNTYYSYNRNDKMILDCINLKISSSKVIGVIGPIGSGKTALLEMISGVKVPTKGKVIVDDIVISKRIQNNELEQLSLLVGYLSQHPEEQFKYDTIKNEISCKMEPLNLMAEEIDDKIREVFRMLGINESLLERNILSLSSSELRQVALATILIYNPNIILLDEPTVGLDAVSKRNVINTLIKLKRVSDKIVLVASSDVDFVNKVADEIIILKAGKVIKFENKNEIFKDVKFLVDNQISVPQISLFEDLVLTTKGIRLGIRDDINDLVKDILRKY